MQKLLKRSAQAERQALRRARKLGKAYKLALEKVDFSKRVEATQIAHKSMKDAVRWHRHAWEMGPLTPQRDTPLKDSTDAYWGSLNANRGPPDSLPAKLRELACRWAGGYKTLCIKEGDRVAITEGPDKGKISVVKSVHWKGAYVVLADKLLQQNYTIPQHLAACQGDGKIFIQSNDHRVPIQAIRLVHPLRNPETGITRDVIINELVVRNFFLDKATRRRTWTRIVPGLNIEIPWPDAFEEAERQKAEAVFESLPADTQSIDVQKVTFVPTLLESPVPDGLIDELRNRYSKFRTRHTDEYIAKKTAQEAEKSGNKKLVLTMRTPLQEFHAKIRAERKARGQPKLTDDMLVKLGEFMAASKKKPTPPEAGIAKPHSRRPTMHSLPASTIASESQPPPPS